MRFSSIVLIALLSCSTNGFVHNYQPKHHHGLQISQQQRTSSYLFRNLYHDSDDDTAGNNHRINNKKSRDLLTTFCRRLTVDTIESAGLQNVHTAGFGGSITGLVQKVKSLPDDIKNLTWKDVKPIQRIKGLHGPITYMIIALLFARKYPWAWKNPAWWFGVAFCVKWFRARYVFKIPVWDRQPNWNNVITSKDQEKDLKAFTCKTCGSTIFIAKTREFFFEGNTGIGGLGCFSCGARGADNFIMDRDRIVEDVADIDDYFEYERPLDFISRAERRALMKEAGGDEEKANQLLIDRTNAQASEESQAQAEAIVNGGKVESVAEDIAIVVEEEEVAEEKVQETSIEKVEDSSAKFNDDEKGDEKDISAQSTPVESKTEEKVKEKKPKESKKAEAAASTSSPKKAPSPPPSDDDLDLLEMDDF